MVLGRERTLKGEYDRKENIQRKYSKNIDVYNFIVHVWDWAINRSVRGNGTR
jgi:hypothetical protein